MKKCELKSIANRFSAAADTYDRHSGVQVKAASGLMKLIGQKPAFNSILEIGCGTGILTVKLADSFPSASICAIDISKKMISEAKWHLGPVKKVKLIARDFRELPGLGKFELVTSSSSLHWITPLSATFRKIHGLLATNGTFAFGLMLKGTLAELHKTRSRIAPSKAVQKQLLTENEVLNDLRSSRFSIIRKHRITYRAIFKSSVCFLKSLHEQGVTSGPFASGRKRLTRHELEQLVSYYDAHYKCRGGVFASYEVLHVVAKETEKMISRRVRSLPEPGQGDR